MDNSGLLEFADFIHMSFNYKTRMALLAKNMSDYEPTGPMVQLLALAPLIAKAFKSARPTFEEVRRCVARAGPTSMSRQAYTYGARYLGGEVPGGGFLPTRLATGHRSC